MSIARNCGRRWRGRLGLARRRGRRRHIGTARAPRGPYIRRAAHTQNRNLACLHYSIRNLQLFSFSTFQLFNWQRLLLHHRHRPHGRCLRHISPPTRVQRERRRRPRRRNSRATCPRPQKCRSRASRPCPQRCRQCIAAGLHRTGARWAHCHVGGGATPDIMCIGKELTIGVLTMPIHFRQFVNCETNQESIRIRNCCSVLSMAALITSKRGSRNTTNRQ